MKKIISVLLATIMLFSVISVASAADLDTFYKTGLVDRNTQAILTFDLNGGTLKNSAHVYDTSAGAFVIKDGADVKGKYIMLPQSSDQQVINQFVKLPVVNAPSGWQFDGWYCYYDGNQYAANGSYKIPANAAGKIIEFYAGYSPAELEEDTLGSILGILIKVFGAISGIILYNGDTEQGIALFDKILGALNF